MVAVGLPGQSDVFVRSEKLLRRVNALSVVPSAVEALERRLMLHAGHSHDPAVVLDEEEYLQDWHAREHQLAGAEAALYGHLVPRAAPAVLAAEAAGDPAVLGQWGATLNWSQVAVHAVLLPTGKIFYWEYNGRTRLWDPQTGGVTDPADPGFNIFCVGASVMADGRVFVAGGHIDNGKGLASAAIYDPFTDTWERVADMNGGRWYPSATTLPNGDVLITSGTTETGAWNTLPQVWQEGPDTWRNLTGAVRQQEYYPRMFVLPDGRLVDAGPNRTTRYLNASGAGAWTTGPLTKFNYRDYGSAVMYEPGKIMYAGGGNPPTATAEVIDLNQPNPQWRNVGSMSVARRQTNATILPDGTVLVTGGTSGSGFNNRTTPVFSAELWNPATEQFTTLASMTQPRWYHSVAMLLPDGRVVSAGGDDTPTAEVFSPPYLFKGARPTIGAAPDRIEWGRSFSVSTAEAADIAGVTLVRFGAVTHAHDFDQRFLKLGFTRSGSTLNVAGPANSNVAPPGYYMLFVLNSAGVPSVAKVLRVDVAPPGAGTPLTLVGAGTSWKYKDDGIDPGAGWRAAGFDDSAWKAGNAQLGYGDGDEATTVSFGANSANKHVTTWFRKSFTIADPSIYNELRLRLLRDDGAIVYVHGVEAVRSNMPGGAVTSSTYASVGQDRPDEATFFNFTLPASLLVRGTNVVAVEVHQATADSSDVSFDLQLIGVVGATVTAPAAPSGLTATAGSSSSISLSWTDHSGDESGFRIERATDSGFGGSVTAVLVGADVTSYTDTGLSSSVTYYYRVFAYNGAGLSGASNTASAMPPAPPPPPPPPPPGETTLVAAGSAWKFLDNGTTPGAAWRSAGFEDSGWRSGTAQLGYGDGDEATTVSFGPSQSSKYVTTYFRRAFTVADPSTITSLQLRLLRDDGAVVYINGMDVARSNMPEGAIDGGTLASVGQDRPDEATFFEFTVGASVLVAGTNVIAVEVHQATLDSSDVSFDLALIATTGAPTTIVPARSAWWYLDNGSNQGTAWRANGFDDSAWKTGNAQIGYGDGDERTVVLFGPNAANKYVTTYFRKTFTVADPSAYTSLTLRLLRDDGAVVYVNGVEVLRSNMPSGTITYATLAPVGVDTAQESLFLQSDLSPSVLVAGTNVIAVEVHQSSPGSSDLSFDLELIGGTRQTVVGGEQLATVTEKLPARRLVPLPRAVFSRAAIKPRQREDVVPIWDD